MMSGQATVQTQTKAKPAIMPAVSGLLQRKCACGGSPGMDGECAECRKKKQFGLQTKLTVNEPGDIYEQEADRVAGQLMAGPPHHSVGGTPPRIQSLAGQATEGTMAAPASVDRVLDGPGKPLDPPLQQDMEQRFGHDFSRVRVHTGAAAGQSAHEVNAHAYTVGPNIVFGAGQFAPNTHEGRRLMAHELTHVVQQDGEQLHQARTQAREGAATGGAPSGREKGPVNFLSTATKRRTPIGSSESSSTPTHGSTTSSQHRQMATARKAAVTRHIQADRGDSDKLPTPAVPFPGVYVPGYEPFRFIGVPFTYTEKDRDALLDGLKKRIKENRTNMAKFLGTYVEATMDIWGRYVSSEMSDAATKSGSGLAAKLLKFVVTESLAILAGGGVGVVFRPLVGKVAGEALSALADKVTDFTGGLVTDSMQNDLLAEDLKKRQEALDKINASLAAQTGEFVTAGVESLADDSIDRTKWLTKAPLSQLDLFRIPGAIPAVDKRLIRSVVAGVIAAKAHQHDADKPCDSWGLQCGIAETVPKGSVGELDDNVVKIGLKPVASGVSVNYIRFFSASPVLAKELAQRAQLNMVPQMALRIEVDRGDSALAARTILAAAENAIQSDPEAEDRFTRRYEQLIKQSGRNDTTAQNFANKLGGDDTRAKNLALLTRNPAFGLRMTGVGLAESLWLYELASKDSSLSELAGRLERRHLFEQENVVSDTNEPVSQRPSASRLAELTHAVIEPMLPKGVEKMIADYLGRLVLPSVEPKGRRVAR